MRRNTVLAVLVALFAILFFAVVPSVSASATIGSTPSPIPPACCTSDSTLPQQHQPAYPLPLTSKDPSKDVVPPAGTVPLVNNACDPCDPCPYINDPADLPITDSQTVTITIDEYNSLINEISDMQFRGFLTVIGLIVASVIVLVLLLIDRSMERRQNRELASKQVTPGYKLN